MEKMIRKLFKFMFGFLACRKERKRNKEEGEGKEEGKNGERKMGMESPLVRLMVGVRRS